MIASNHMLFPCLCCGFLSENIDDFGACSVCQAESFSSVLEMVESSYPVAADFQGPHTLIVDSCPIVGKSGV